MINVNKLLRDASVALSGSNERDFIEEWVPILVNEVPILIRENTFLSTLVDELKDQIDEQ